MPHNADAARDQWHAWVNPLALRRLARDTSTLTAPIDDRLTGVIVLFDMSGFTALAEELAKAGPIGAERLKERLDACFGAVTTLVHQHGGVVLTYPGDGLLALWAGATPDGVADQAARAATCCLEAVARFNASNDAALQLRAGLAAGSVDVFCVGGVADRWEWFVSGDPVRRAGAAVAAATAGQVVIDAAARSTLADRAHCVAAASGMQRLTKLNDAPSGPLVSSINSVGRSFDAESLRPFISAPVLAHLDAGHAEWLAAFRPATVMFVRLGDEARHAWQLDTLHGVMCAVQSVVTHYGGNVNQALIDDKGTVVVAGWGLAMHVHEDDAARAVEAALNVTAALRELECPSAIGIASGRIFTGIRGSRERREYAMIGDVVNLAARLMQDGDGITCDDKTRAAARQRFVFEKRPAITVKGRSAAVAIYRPLRARDDGRGDLVGRDRELAMLLERTRALELEQSSGVVVLEGEPGIGKSRLTAALQERVQGTSLRTIVARGHPVERSSSYHAWRPVFSRLLHVEGVPAVDARGRVLALLDATPDLAAYAPLLNAVLPLGFAETDATRRMSAQGGAEMVRNLLVRLFHAVSRGVPSLLIIEDAHWLDSASWAVADALARSGEPLLMVATMRPMLPSEMTAECRRVYDRPDVIRLALDHLTPDETAALAARSLGADVLPTEAGDFIWRRAAGHPFFSEQLALALRDAGAIRITDGECSLVADRHGLETLTLPDTVQGVVTSRIDRLTPQQQTALKIASVLGPAFTSQAIRELFPGEIAPDTLAADLEAMVTLRLLVSGAAADDAGRGDYVFKHAITRQVTYDLMPFAQRRELHTAVAQHLEAGEGNRDYALLAHHWSEAGVAGKAFDCFIQAGETAARADANPEAAHFFDRALALDLAAAGMASGPAQAGDHEARAEIALRRARCHRRFGEVSFVLGDLDKANASVDASFALLDGGRHRAPGRVTAILAQAAVQIAHLVVPRAVESSDPFRRRWHEERSKTAGLLALLKATPLDTVGMLGATLLSLNAAERAGSTNVFALGMLGYAAQAMGAGRQSARYFARARAKAFELNELGVYLGLAVAFESMARFGAGDHVRLFAERRVDLQTARDIGDRRGVSRGAAILGAAGAFTLTVHTDELLEWVADSLEANRDQPGVEQAYYLNLKAVIWSMFFRPEQAAPRVVPLIDEMNASLERAPADAAALSFASQALFYTRQGDLPAAAVVLDRALGWLRQNLSMAQPTGWSAFHGTAEPSLAIYREALATNRGVHEAGRRAHESVNLLRRYARGHAVYRARWQYFAGILASLEKRPDAARGHWESALATSQRLSLELDEGLARLALAETQGGARSEHLARAREIFTTRGAPYFVDRVDTIATLTVHRSGT